MRRRDFLAGTAAAGTAIAGFPAFLGTARAADAVTVLTPFGFIPDFIEIMNAASGGHFAKQGINAKIVGVRGAAQVMQQVTAGQAQFARTSGIDIITAVAKAKLPLIAISTLYQGSTFQMVSRKDKPVLTGADLKGKTVGVISINGASDHFLDLILVKVGLQKTDITREVVGNGPGSLQFVNQGRIDCFICSINVVATLEMTGQPVTYWSMDKYAPMPSEIFLASRDFVTAQPELTVRFLRGLKASVDELMTAPLIDIFTRAQKDFEIEGLKDMAAAVAIEKLTIDRLWLAQGRQNLLRNVPALWQSGVDALQDVGLIDPTDPTTVYTNAYIDATKA